MTTLSHSFSKLRSKLSWGKEISSLEPQQASSPDTTLKSEQTPPQQTPGNTSREVDPHTARNDLEISLETLSAISEMFPLGQSLSSVIGPVLAVMTQIEPTSHNAQGFVELAAQIKLLTAIISDLGTRDDANTPSDSPDGLNTLIRRGQIVLKALRKEFESMTMDMNAAKSRGTLEHFFDSANNAACLTKYNKNLTRIFAMAMTFENLEAKLGRDNTAQIQMEDITGGVGIPGSSGNVGGEGGEGVDPRLQLGFDIQLGFANRVKFGKISGGTGGTGGELKGGAKGMAGKGPVTRVQHRYRDVMGSRTLENFESKWGRDNRSKLSYNLDFASPILAQIRMEDDVTVPSMQGGVGAGGGTANNAAGGFGGAGQGPRIIDNVYADRVVILDYYREKAFDKILPPLKGNSRGRDLREPERNVKNGTFVIHSPAGDMIPEEATESFTTDDLTCVQSNLGVAGCVISVHEPTEAASWMNKNWHSALLTSVRNSGCGGPFPWMLSTIEPALAIFGNYNEPVIVNMARSLAEASGFPVVIRPESDNPVVTLLAHDTDPQNGYIQLGNQDGNNDEQREAENEDEEITEERRVPGERDNGGRRDDDLDGVEANQWLNAVEENQPDRHAQGTGGDGGGPSEPATAAAESPLHRTSVKLRLQVNTVHTYTVHIDLVSKFAINQKPDIPLNLNDLTPPLSSSEVIALVDLKIQNRPRETQIDRSYASIGFVAHRYQSIVDPEFFHRGFDLPDKIYKRTQQRQIQHGFQGAIGGSHTGPMGTLTYSHNRNNTTTLEAADNKVLPKCRVEYEIGDTWDDHDGQKSYSSFNIAYQLQDVTLDAERSEYHPTKIRVGMGVNLRPSGSKALLPKISFVNRNQVLIWVSDPQSKVQIRGILVLMSSYLDDVRLDKGLSIYTDEKIELGDKPRPNGIQVEPNTSETISLLIAQVEKQAASISKKLRGVFSSFFTNTPSSASPPADITAHEYLARGWDANNKNWRNVLWPALDKHFRAADPDGTAPVRNIRCPWEP